MMFELEDFLSINEEIVKNRFTQIENFKILYIQKRNKPNLEAKGVLGKILPSGESKYIILNIKNRQKIKEAKFTKKEIQLINKYVQNHPTSWKVKEVHIKSIVNTFFTCSDWQEGIFSFIFCENFVEIMQ